MSAISACVFPESSLFYFSPGALHLPHAHQRGREGGIHCGTHLTRLRIDKAQGAQAAQPVRSRLGASYCKLTALTEAGALILAGTLLRSAVAGVRAGSP